jgi:hypothetical protein
MLLAIALVLVGASASEAQQRTRAKRTYAPTYYYVPKYYNPPRYYYAPRGESECQRRARAEDPTGLYAGYPCWARESFGRGGSGRGR